MHSRSCFPSSLETAPFAKTEYIQYPRGPRGVVFLAVASVLIDLQFGCGAGHADAFGTTVRQQGTNIDIVVVIHSSTNGRRTMSNRMTKVSETGTTVTELMVSVTVAAVLLGLMALGLQGMVDHVNLQAATSEVVSDLRHARLLAMEERQPIEVSLDTHQITVTLLRNRDSSKPVQALRLLGQRGVRAMHSTGGSSLWFSPHGTNATPTTLTLEGRNGNRRVVTVSLTGIVRAR
jgi:Tfp pilus assembly protein FimT